MVTETVVVEGAEGGLGKGTFSLCVSFPFLNTDPAHPSTGHLPPWAMQWGTV